MSRNEKLEKEILILRLWCGEVGCAGLFVIGGIVCCCCVCCKFPRFLKSTINSSRGGFIPPGIDILHLTPNL